jgi:hypothetical protein
MDTSFAEVIREHLELRERNVELGRAMPVERIKLESAAHLDDTDELDDVRCALTTAGDAATPDSSDDLWSSPVRSTGATRQHSRGSQDGPVIAS